MSGLIQQLEKIIGKPLDDEQKRQVSQYVLDSFQIGMKISTAIMAETYTTISEVSAHLQHQIGKDPNADLSSDGAGS